MAIALSSGNTINRSPKIVTQQPIIDKNSNKIIHIPLSSDGVVTCAITKTWPEIGASMFNFAQDSDKYGILSFTPGNTDIQTVFNLTVSNTNHLYRDDELWFQFSGYKLGSTTEKWNFRIGQTQYLDETYLYTLEGSTEVKLVSRHYTEFPSLGIFPTLLINFYHDDDDKLVIDIYWNGVSARVIKSGCSPRITSLTTFTTNAKMTYTAGDGTQKSVLSGSRKTAYVELGSTYSNYSLPWPSY